MDVRAAAERLQKLILEAADVLTRLGQFEQQQQVACHAVRILAILADELAAEAAQGEDNEDAKITTVNC